MKQRYLVGTFAGHAGVTVRALHHYDRLGLLRPAQRSDTNYRLYNDGDLVRLQQIVTLKALGFDLDAIAQIINAPDFDLPTALRRQIQLLEERRRKIDVAIRAIRDAECHVSEVGAASWETLVPVIKATIAMHSIDYKKYFTAEQLDNLRLRFTKEDQARISERWKQLFLDIEASSEEDPASPAAQALLNRWDSLIAEFTQNDSRLQRSLLDLYSDPENRAKATQAMPSLPSASAFIARVRAARGTP